MSGTCFRGRGFGPRGARPKVPTNAFSGPRIPHPNFNRVNFNCGFPPWQPNCKFPQRPQFRGNLPFRFNGRGRMPNGPGTNRFMGPVRPPVPQFPMGVRGNIRPRVGPPVLPPPLAPSSDHLQDKSTLLPQVPLLGSEEERQQKISETADKLKQKLSSITEEDLTNFWEDDFSLLPNAGSDAEFIQSKGIPELSHEPPELDLTFTDFRDIGRVDSNDARLDNLGNAIDEDDVIITFAGEPTHDIHNVDDEIVLEDDTRKQTVQSLESTDDNALLDVPDALLKSTTFQENQNSNISNVSCHTNKSDDNVAVESLALTNTEAPEENVSSTISEHNSLNLIDIHTVINEISLHPSDAGATSLPISVPQEQRTTPELNFPEEDVLQQAIEENRNSIENKLHSSQNTQHTNTLGEEDCQTSSTTCISSEIRTTHVPSNTLYVQSNISHNLQSTTCFNYEGTQPSNGDKITHEPENAQAPFNGAQRFHPTVPPWVFQQNNDNSFIRGPQRLPCHKQPLLPRPNIPFCQTGYRHATFGIRAPPPFANPVPVINHDRQFHPIPPFSANNLPLNFDPSEPPPNMRPQTMPRFPTSNEALHHVPPFASGCQSPLMNVPPSNINLSQPPPVFDPREPPPRATTITSSNENLPYFNPQEAPPKLQTQEGVLCSPASYNSQHSTQDNSTLTTYSSSPNGCMAPSANLTLASHSTDFNITATLTQPPHLLAGSVLMTYPPHNNIQQVNTAEIDDPLPTIDQPHNVNMIDGLEDMQDAMEFANQAMNMNDNFDENDCAIAPTLPDVPVSEIPVPNENHDFTHPLEPDQPAPVKKSTKECKSKKIEENVASTSESVVEIEPTPEKVEENRAENAPLIDEQIRPKVMFNLNSKTRKINKPQQWCRRNDERSERKHKNSPQRNAGNRGLRGHDKLQDKKHDQKKSRTPKLQQMHHKERPSVRDKTHRGAIAETITSENSKSQDERSNFQSSSTTSINASTSASTTSSTNASTRKTPRLKRPPKKIEIPKSETSWKDRVIKRFLKMSKNDICNMVNNSSLRKFDIAMKHLVKEKRTSLSLEMRNTENEKMKGYDRDEFMTQLNAMLDPGAVVDITNLPTEFIHHLSEVLQLDPMPFDSELCFPPDLDINDPDNSQIIDPFGQENMLDESLGELIGDEIADNNTNAESERHLEPQILDAIQDISETNESHEMHISPTQDRNPTPTCTASHSCAVSPKQSSTDKTQTETSHKKPLFNTSDLDDILSVVTEKSKITCRSLSPCELKSDLLNPSPKGNPETSTIKETPAEVPDPENADQDTASLSEIARAKFPSKSLDSEYSRSRKSNSEDRCTFHRGRYDRWSKKERENPDKFRNLTKEEWEAKHGRRNATTSAFFVSRRSNPNNTDNSVRRGLKSNCQSRKYFSDSPRRFSASPVNREPVVHTVMRHLDKRKEAEEPQRPERERSSSDSSSSSSDSESEPVDSDVTKLLKVIKEKEKIAKKRSLNETIRDEVAAEIEKTWREKGKHRDRKSHRHDKRRRDRKGKRRKFKKRKRRRDFESSTSEFGEQREERQLLAPNEIKTEVIVKEEPNTDGNLSHENEIASILPLLNDETIALIPAREDIPEEAPIIDQLGTVAACDTVQTEVNSKPPTCPTISQPKTKAQLKQISEPSNVHKKPVTKVTKGSKEVETNNANIIKQADENNRNETTKKVVSAQTDEGISVNNNSLHPIDLPLDNTKLTSVEDSSVHSKSKETPPAFNTSITHSETNVSNAPSDRDSHVPATKVPHQPSVPRERKATFTEEAVHSITNRLEVVGGKSGCKKIDIKEYKERALQRWLKEQVKLKEIACPMTEQQQEQQSLMLPTIKIKPRSIETESSSTEIQQRPMVVETEQKRLLDPRLARKDTSVVSTSQVTPTKEMEQKAPLDTSHDSTDAPQERKEGFIRIRNIDELSDSRFREKSCASQAKSESAVDGVAKCKDSERRATSSEKRSLDHRKREEHKLHSKEKDLKKIESAADLERFRNIRSEGGKELKLKKETMKKSVEKRKRSPKRNQSKPTVLSITKVHLPRNLGMINQESLTKEVLNPVQESTSLNKDSCSDNLEAPQIENSTSKEVVVQAQITRTDDSSPNVQPTSVVEKELKDSAKDTLENKPECTQSNVHLNAKNESVQIKQSERNEATDQYVNATTLEMLSTDDQNDSETEVRVAILDEIDIKEQPISLSTDEKIDLRSNQEDSIKFAHVSPHDVPDLNDGGNGALKEPLVKQAPPEIKDRLVEGTLTQTSLVKSVLPVVVEEGAKEQTLSPDTRTDEATSKNLNDIKSSVEATCTGHSTANTEIGADVEDSNNAKTIKTSDADANKLPEAVSTEYHKSVEYKKFELGGESSPDSPRSPLKGFAPELAAENVYVAPRLNLSFEATNDAPINKSITDEASFSNSRSWEKVRDDTKIVFTEDNIRCGEEIKIQSARPVENQDPNSSSSGLSEANESRVDRSENSAVSRPGPLRIKTRDINELLNKAKSTAQETKNNEAISQNKSDGESTANEKIAGPEIEDCIAGGTNNCPTDNSREIITSYNAQSYDFVPTDFPVLSGTRHEDEKNEAAYGNEKSCREKHVEKAIGAQTLPNEDESLAQKEAWENIMTCLIPLSKSQMPNTTETISVSFNVPPSCSVSKVEKLPEPNAQSDLQAPLEKKPEKSAASFTNNLPNNLKAEAAEFSDKSAPKEVAQESGTIISAPIEVRKTEQKNLQHSKPVEVRKSSESFNRMKTDNTRAGIDIPKRLNVPTKAALKESVENLFIPSTYVSSETKTLGTSEYNNVKVSDATTSNRAASKTCEAIPAESEHRTASSTSSKLNDIEKGETVSYSLDTNKSSNNSVHHNPVVELEKLKNMDAMVGTKHNSTEKVDNNVEPEPRKKSSKKRESDPLHKIRNKQKMKQTKEKERSLSEKKAKEMMKSGLTQIGHPTSKETIMARMIEIDVEIHKLMTEKMTLYQMLENNVLPDECSSQADSTTHENAEDATSNRPRTPSALMSQLIQNIEVSPVISVQSPAKGSTEITSSKSNIDNTQSEKQKSSLKTEHSARKRNCLSRSSEDEEMMSHFENVKHAKKKKKKLERVVKFEDTSEGSSAVHDTTAKKKRHSDATKSILKKVSPEPKLAASVQSNAHVPAIEVSSNVDAREEIEKCSTSFENKTKTSDLRYEEKEKLETPDGQKIQTDKISSNDCSSSGDFSNEKNKDSIAEGAHDKSESKNVNDETSLTAHQTKKSKKETVTKEAHSIARKDIEVLNEEETANLMPKLPEIRALEKSAIYSDDSTWESVLQNPTLETCEQKKPNTGLALLEETYKKEMAKSRKLQARARKKKKKQLHNLLESVNALTPDEEELPLSTLYIKKLQQKRDLLNSLDQNVEESGDLKAQTNVDEVINAVAENRVEELGVEQTKDNQAASEKVSDATLLDNDQLTNNEGVCSTSGSSQGDGEEALASSGDVTNETDYHSAIDHKDEVSQKVKCKEDEEVCGTKDSALQEKNAFPEDKKLSSAQSIEVITSHDSSSKIKKNVPQNSVQSNLKNNKDESILKTTVDNNTAAIAETSKNAASNSDLEKKIEEPLSTSLQVDIDKKEDASKAKLQREISTNQKHISQTAQQTLSTPGFCEKKDEKVRSVTACKNREKTTEKCVRDESVTDTTVKKSNLDLEDSESEKGISSITTIGHSKISAKREQHQKVHSRSTTEKLDRVAQVESSKGPQRTRKESDRSRDSTGEEENRQYYSVSQPSTSDDLSSRKLKRKRGNGRAAVRRSTRYTEETTKRLKTQPDANLQTKEQGLQDRHLHLGLVPDPPSSLSSYEEDHEGASSTSRKHKAQANRKRSMHCELETTFVEEPLVNSGSSAEQRLTSADTALLQSDTKHVTKKRKPNAALEMMSCEVRLVDSRFTILRPDANPDLLRKFGISTINQFQKPVEIDLTINASQSTSEDGSIPETILLSPAIEDTSENASKSSKKCEDTNKSSGEQSNLVKIKNVQKTSKSNLLVSEREDPKIDDDVLPILTREQASKSDAHYPEKPDIEIVEEKKLDPDNQNDDNEVEFELSITEPNNEKEITRTQYTVHKGPILDIKVFGNSFLAASEDGTIYRYSQASNGILNIYKGHKAAVTCLYVYSSGFADRTKELMFSGSLDGTLRRYNITTGKQRGDSADVGSPVQCMDQAWGVIFIGTKSGHVLRYHIESRAIKGDRIEFSEKSVLALKATNEGPRRVLIVASRNQPITIRDAQSGLFLRTISGQRSHTVYSLMRDHNLIYCGTSSTSIPVFDFTNGEQTMQYDAGVGIVCMRLYQRFLFAGCYDGNIYVFDTKNHKLVCSIPGPGNMLLSMEIVDDKIIAGSKDKRLQSWQMPKQVLCAQPRIS